MRRDADAPLPLTSSRGSNGWSRNPVERFDMQEGIFGANHAHAGSSWKVWSPDRPAGVIDFKTPATIDDRPVQREHPADIALGAPVEAALARRWSDMSESGPAKSDARNRQERKDQTLMLR